MATDSAFWQLIRLLVSISSSLWVTLIFRAWVRAVSLYVLVWNPCSPSASLQGGRE